MTQINYNTNYIYELQARKLFVKCLLVTGACLRSDSLLPTSIRDSKQCHIKAVIYCHGVHCSDSDVLGAYSTISMIQTNPCQLANITYFSLSLSLLSCPLMPICFKDTLELVLFC